MKDKNVLLSLVPSLAGLLLAIGVMTVFSACGIKDDGTFMHCHDAQISVALSGGCIAVFFALAAFLKNRIARIIFNVAALVVSVRAFLLPGILMPMCMMRTMRCYTVMQPFVRIITVICALFALWGIIRSLKK